MAVPLFHTGVEFVTGIPGAGKSFYLVERLLGWILEEQRPVYTNLPLRWRVMREYLRIKGGENAARLVQVLTEERFNLFLSAYGRRQQVISAAVGEGLSRAAAIRRFEDSEIGLRDCWIPAGSVICVDEVHHWYPNPALSNVRKPEPEELMTFLTMHRHGQYLVVVATQAERQISTTFKSLCSSRVQVRRWDKEPLFWGFSLEWIGWPVLRYEEYMGEDDPERTKPLKTFTRFPKLPCLQVLFRLYESFTHAGGRWEAASAVRKARVRAGLIVENAAMPKSRFVSRAFFGSARWLRKFAVFGVLIYGSWMASRSWHQTPDPSDFEVVVPDFVLKGTAIDRAFFDDGSSLAVGASVQGFDLVMCLPRRGTCIWENDGAFYYQKVGSAMFGPIDLDRLREATSEQSGADLVSN